MHYTRFSDLEGLKIAAEMERRGGEFYRHAARISKNPASKELLRRLAEDEKIHCDEFSNLTHQLLMGRDEGADQYYDEEASAYLSAVAAEVVFSGGLMDLAKGQGLESPIAILQHSIQSEKDSILFYSEMILQARNPQTRQVFQQIVCQEKNHLNKLQKMLREQPLEG